MTRMPTSDENRALYERHSDVLRMLANPLRHEMLHLLAEKDRTGGELAELTGATKSNVSQHISLLKAYGLVESQREGRSVRLRLTYPQLAQACALIDEILHEQARRDLAVLEAATH